MEKWTFDALARDGLDMTQEFENKSGEQFSMIEWTQYNAKMETESQSMHGCRKCTRFYNEGAEIYKRFVYVVSRQQFQGPPREIEIIESMGN
jgi:hypothetical protein